MGVHGEESGDGGEAAVGASVKWIDRAEFVKSEKRFGAGEGGKSQVAQLLTKRIRFGDCCHARYTGAEGEAMVAAALSHPAKLTSQPEVDVQSSR